MIALIDADSIIHIVAYHYAVPKESLEFLGDGEEKEQALAEMYNAMDNKVVLDHVDSFINDILNKTNSYQYLGFLGAREGSNTFRHKQAKTKPYKGNRGNTPHWTKYWKPIMVEHMVENWKFIELFNIEADDAVAMCATKFGLSSVVCSPDKDLRQIPGNYYDYKKQESGFVSELDSIKHLYSQCLVGDSTDNIGGCPKIGKKSPHLEFPGCEKLSDFHEYTFKVFQEKKVPELMQEMLMLVYMLRIPDGVDIKVIPEPIDRPVFGNITENIVQEDDIDELKFEPPTFTQ